MKKIILTLSFLFITLSSYSQWGISAGFSSGEVAVSVGNIAETADYTGFGFGIVSEWDYSESIKFDTGLSFGSFDTEGSDDRSSQLSLGTTLKYYTAPGSGFHLRGGIATSLSLEEKVEDFSQTGVSASLGLGLDVTEMLTITASIATSLTEAYTGPLDIDTDSKAFGVGLIVRF
jgi:hypothetical protein